VQAKGRLQGEELLQFQERGVALQQELRKQYNLSGEEFQDALVKARSALKQLNLLFKTSQMPAANTPMALLLKVTR
jgi:phage tail tape-measure protein